MKAVLVLELLLFVVALGALALFGSSISGDASMLNDFEAFVAGS